MVVIFHYLVSVIAQVGRPNYPTGQMTPFSPTRQSISKNWNTFLIWKFTRRLLFVPTLDISPICPVGGVSPCVTPMSGEPDGFTSRSDWNNKQFCCVVSIWVMTYVDSSLCQIYTPLWDQTARYVKTQDYRIGLHINPWLNKSAELIII